MRVVETWKCRTQTTRGGLLKSPYTPRARVRQQLPPVPFAFSEFGGSPFGAPPSPLKALVSVCGLNSCCHSLCCHCAVSLAVTRCAVIVLSHSLSLCCHCAATHCAVTALLFTVLSLRCHCAVTVLSLRCHSLRCYSLRWYSLCWRYAVTALLLTALVLTELALCSG